MSQMLEKLHIQVVNVITNKSVAILEAPKRIMNTQCVKICY